MPHGSCTVAGALWLLPYSMVGALWLMLRSMVDGLGSPMVGAPVFGDLWLVPYRAL